MASKGPQLSQFGKLFRVFGKNHSSPQPYSVILDHRQSENGLLFESGIVAVISSQDIDTTKRQYTKITDAFGCLGILQLNTEESTLLYLVVITGCTSIGKIGECEIYRITQTAFISLRNQPQDEDLISEIKKLLNSGTFYFSRSIVPSNTFDISLCCQRQQKTNTTDNRFFWNRMLHIYFLKHGIDTSTWLLRVMCGNVEIRTVYIRHRQAKAVIISRVSCERAGTRFNVRGCNDDGHVANFVETEQAIFLEDAATSYLQIRGSVPLFWEQPGVQVGSHKVKLSRSIKACAAAYNKHWDKIKQRYGSQVIVNLLSSSQGGNKEGEVMLGQLYQNHHSVSNHSDVPFISFDYHYECRGGNTTSLSKLKEQVENYLNSSGFFFAKGDDMVQEQNGTIRTNCVDCLDRTNNVQTFFGLEILPRQIAALCESEGPQIYSRFEEVFKQMWVNNGNEVSKTYAGTGAIQGGSKLMDGARSAARTIQNNLLDFSKQEAMDIFLSGNTLNGDLVNAARLLLPSSSLHVSPNLIREMCSRYRDYTYAVPLRIAVGTYNVNGGKHFRSVAYKDVSLSDWLLDAIQIAKTKSLIDSYVNNEDVTPIDIFAIGFEEIVDLNASNIVAASSDNATLWAEELEKVLSRDLKYFMLTYIQLVGVCLFIFVRSEYADVIKDVAVDSVKTGLGGAAGNKGAVAIRFVMYNTSMCFVCSHFAAGQSQVNERNADYTEITKKLEFPMGRTLFSHDYVFWCGDFNYRVDMDKDVIKDLVKNNELGEILQYDQLIIQKRENKVFHDFLEGDIAFPPTYKYDVFSDDFDTSEKCRAPAWTDRVLWKKRKMYPDENLSRHWNPGKLIHYGRAELKHSDHRPVIAILEIDSLCVYEERRDELFKEILEEIGPEDATVAFTVSENVSGDKKSIFNDNFVKNLLTQLDVANEVSLVKFYNDALWVIFKDSKIALTVYNKGKVNVDGNVLETSLRSPNWVEQILKEISICCDNTVPLCDSYSSASYVDKLKNLTVGKPNSGRSSPSRPPLPALNKAKEGLFSVPSNLHQPLEPEKVDTSKVVTHNVPVRPAPPVPGNKSPPFATPVNQGPPPVPHRITPVSVVTAASNQDFVTDPIPPPVPARRLPPIPPR